MPKTDQKGNFIISAGEVGTYVVCPEAWYLEKIAKKKPESKPNMQEGKIRHKAWESSVNEAIIYTWASKVIFLLIVLLIVFYLFTKMQGV